MLRPFAVEGMQEPLLSVVNHQDFFNPESRIGAPSAWWRLYREGDAGGCTEKC